TRGSSASSTCPMLGACSRNPERLISPRRDGSIPSLSTCNPTRMTSRPLTDRLADGSPGSQNESAHHPGGSPARPSHPQADLQGDLPPLRKGERKDRHPPARGEGLRCGQGG